MANTNFESDLLVSKNDGILSLTFNRPNKKNAINSNILNIFMEQLEVSKSDDSVKVVYITGNGDFFTSGNDLNNFKTNSIEEIFQSSKTIIQGIINYPKVIVVGVNGPAIGFGFTMLLLADIVFCSDNAFFMVPFIKTNQSPEGGSIMTFQKLFGKSVANNLLLNGETMTSEEAKNRGLVLRVFFEKNFQEETYKYLKQLAKNPLNLLVKYKESIVKHFKSELNKTVDYELDEIKKQWNDPDFIKLIQKLLTKKPKF